MKYCALIGLLFVAVLASGCSQLEPVNYPVAQGVKVDVQSPHPYSNGKSGKSIETIVWSHTLKHPGASSLKLHFNRLDVAGELNVPVVYETINIPCPPESSPEATEGVPSAGELVYCGEKTVTKEFTLQEIFIKNYINGDFLMVRDSQNNILDILFEQPPGAGFSKTYDGVDVVVLELYADASENAYGVHVDEYFYGFEHTG